MTIKRKLFAVLICVSVVPLVAFGAFNLSTLRREMDRNQRATSLELLHGVRHHVAQSVAHEAEHVATWAEALGNLDQAEGDQYLAVLSNTAPFLQEFHYAALVDQDRRVIAASQSRLVGKVLPESVELAAALAGEATMQDVELDPWVQEMGLAMFAPVEGQSPRAMVGSIKWDPIVAGIESQQIWGEPQDATQHIMLARPSGEVVACFDPREMFTDNLIALGMNSATLARDGQEGSVMERTEHGVVSLATYTSMRLEGKPSLPPWILILYQDPAVLSAPVQRLSWLFALSLLLTSAGLVGGALYLSGRILRPIGRLTDALRDATHGTFRPLPDVARVDELGDVARIYNQLVAQLAEARERGDLLHEELVHASRLASIGTLAAGVAHEIHHPLTLLAEHQAALRGAVTGGLDGDLVALVDKQARSVDQVVRTVRGLLRYTRIDRSGDGRADLTAVVHETVTLLEPLYQRSGVALEVDLHPLPTVVIGRLGELQQITMCLLNHARASVEGVAYARIRVRTLVADQQVRLEVSARCGASSGAGRERGLDPTLAAPDRGAAALGLSHVEAMVKARGGGLTTDTDGTWCRVGVWIPLASADQGQEVPEA